MKNIFAKIIFACDTKNELLELTSQIVLNHRIMWVMDIDMLYDSLIHNSEASAYGYFFDLTLDSLKFNFYLRVFKPKSFHRTNHQAVHICHKQR